ncbi:MAG TPA: DUF1080 domain-containing protein, partial [Planctomycetia bacterium]|nr:DUF1080 domain-containing protein [Planctomycetia bacterium]
MASAAKAEDGKPQAGFVSLFDGKTLDGWEGQAEIWKVEDGCIVGSHQGRRNNEFLTTKKRFNDFVLKAKFHLVGGKGNSGIQFRSERIPNDPEMRGYQADIGEGYWGALYDESRRNKVLAAPKGKTLDAFNKALKKDGWNDYQVRCMGNKIELSINGVVSVDYVEKDAKIPADGLFGLQI